MEFHAGIEGFGIEVIQKLPLLMGTDCGSPKLYDREHFKTMF